MLDGSGRGNEGVIVAAKCAVVLTGLPDVQLAAEQGDRKRQAHAAERLGQRHDVGRQPCLFETEKGAGTAAARLDIVDDEQHAMRTAQGLQLAQPSCARGIETALALYGLYDD